MITSARVYKIVRVSIKEQTLTMSQQVIVSDGQSMMWC